MNVYKKPLGARAINRINVYFMFGARVVARTGSLTGFYVHQLSDPIILKYCNFNY